MKYAKKWMVVAFEESIPSEIESLFKIIIYLIMRKLNYTMKLKLKNHKMTTDL
jgi:hypothetical protein